MKKILLLGKSFTYDIEYRSIASLRLRLKTRTSFIISCHRLTPAFIISKFITDHQDWILKNSRKITLKKNLKALKTFKILDEIYEISIKKMPRDSVVIFKDEHKIYINTTSLSSSHLKTLLYQKFRPLALSLIKADLSKLSSLRKFKYGHVSVKNTTSRFGSCSSTNNLNFNWQIIFLPKNIYLHILLHELTHLKIKNHSPNFWHKLSVYDPDCRCHRQYLRVSAAKHFIV